MVKPAKDDQSQTSISAFFRPRAPPPSTPSNARGVAANSSSSSAIRGARTSDGIDGELILLDSSDDDDDVSDASRVPPRPLKRVKLESTVQDPSSSSAAFAATSSAAASSSSANTMERREVDISQKVSKWQYKPPTPSSVSETPQNDDAHKPSSSSSIAAVGAGGGSTSNGKQRNGVFSSTKAMNRLQSINLLKKKNAFLQDQDPLAAAAFESNGYDASSRHHSSTRSQSPLSPFGDGDHDDDGDDGAGTSRTKQKGKVVAKAQGDGDDDEMDDGDGDGDGDAVRHSRFSKFAAQGMPKTKPAKASGIKYTPLEQQVIALRKAHPGVLLVIEVSHRNGTESALPTRLTHLLTPKVGYKFRFFEEDAVTASRILGIAHFPIKNMMSASIPTHRLDVHIKRLINAGQKVGVVRQKETAALKKADASTRQGPFVRALDGLYTSATYIDPLSVEPLDASSGNAATIVCLVEEARGRDEKVAIGMVAVKPSTGEVIYDEFVDGLMRSELETRLLHLQPSEVVLQPQLSKQTQSIINYLVRQQSSGASDSTCRIDRMNKKLTTEAARKFITNFYICSKAAGASRKGKEKELTREIVIGSDSEDDAEAGPNIGMNGSCPSQVLDLPDLVLVALAALISHLSAFDLSTIFFHESSFEHFSSRSTMNLNGNTLQNLELLQNNTDFTLHGSLLSILDHCHSAFGRRRLRNWICHPLISEARVLERQDAVAEIISSSSNLTIYKLRGVFKGLLDLERGLVRIHFGRASTQELLRILQAFSRVANVFEAIDEEEERDGAPTPQSTVKSALLKQIVASLPKIKKDVDGFLYVFGRSRIKSEQAKAGKKAELFHDPPENLREVRDCLDAVDIEMGALLKEARKVLKKPTIEFRRVAEEEFLLEIGIAESKKIVPGDWIKVNSTKQYYRYRSPQIQAKMDEVNQNRERLEAAADAAFKALLQEITSTSYDAFRAALSNLATADCLFSFAVTAIAPGYVRPTIVREPGFIKIVDGRHPVHEVLSSQPYVPSSIELGGTATKQMILTGINAGGKSSFSRSVALIALMAQIGSYVPAKECTTSLFDGIFTRMGAADEIGRGRSTFMVELSETSEILKLATCRSLVILDELGRGTSTNDGQAIAAAVLENITTTSQARTIFITHYPSLAQLVKKYPEVISVHHMKCLEKQRDDGFTDVTFLYQVGPGLASRSHGLNVARLAELPDSVLSKALEKSQELERTTQERVASRRAERLAWILRTVGEGGEIASGEEEKGALLEACANALL
ncbi:BZ3500_MvSof-1268-A1-R1_Chr4-3g07297 [Microbotryum saponariae]|uniref:MutS protein homolog 3 n=1 Tax=Microbotryum saponariae TaxID=289078 RepID=A0A2X0KUJ2_9BASI|nr:BZ3500_MvSof-1268-A1-R1_Chr4-3g07297 [Microbotryum saponariae]SDA06960.1 BZ3501_MvSof-1269-A2-R1_Chr4-2g07006 [Microbotryum saponariae]